MVERKLDRRQIQLAAEAAAWLVDPANRRQGVERRRPVAPPLRLETHASPWHLVAALGAVLLLTGYTCGGGGGSVGGIGGVAAPAIDGTATLNATVDGITAAGGDRGSAATTNGGTRAVPAGTLSNPGSSNPSGGS